MPHLTRNLIGCLLATFVVESYEVRDLVSSGYRALWTHSRDGYANLVDMIRMFKSKVHTSAVTFDCLQFAVRWR